MKHFDLAVYTQNEDTAREWFDSLQEIQKRLSPHLGERVVRALDAQSAHSSLQSSPIVLLDSSAANVRQWMKGLNRSEHTLVWVVRDDQAAPSSSDLQQVDEVLVAPFRMMDIASIVRRHHLRRHSVSSRSIDDVTAMVKAANHQAEEILERHADRRVKNIKGLSITNRHLSGLKPGGDFFEVFESKNGEWVNFLLTDSSSYGLSSALLGMILASSAKIAGEANLSAADWVRIMALELQSSLGEHEHMSIFFGRLNRRDFTLHYQLYGSIEAYVMDTAAQSFRLEKSGTRINSKFQANPTEHHLTLNPKDRIVLLSDGFVQGVGGEKPLHALFTERRGQDPFNLVNELCFQIKDQLTDGETFPGEDCSAIVIDIESRVLRLAPVG